jgi:hypothetical protein
MNISKAMRIYRKYSKRFKSRFLRREIARKQFNVYCDERLILGLKLSARQLEVPLYVITEHAIQLGLHEIHLEEHDPAYKENLKRHLIQHHLLVDNLDPLDERLGNRVRRLKNAMRFLRFFEISTDVKRQEQLLIKLIDDLAAGDQKNGNKIE